MKQTTYSIVKPCGWTHWHQPPYCQTVVDRLTWFILNSVHRKATRAPHFVAILICQIICAFRMLSTEYELHTCFRHVGSSLLVRAPFVGVELADGRIPNSEVVRCVEPIITGIEGLLFKFEHLQLSRQKVTHSPLPRLRDSSYHIPIRSCADLDVDSGLIVQYDTGISWITAHLGFEDIYLTSRSTHIRAI